MNYLKVVKILLEYNDSISGRHLCSNGSCLQCRITRLAIDIKKDGDNYVEKNKDN